MFTSFMKNKHKLMITAGAIMVLLAVLVFAIQKSKVPENTNGSEVATTPQSNNFWSSLFATQSVATPSTPEVTQVPVTPPQPPVTTDTTQKPKKFWITSDITLLQGEGFFYVEDGVLYRTKLKDGVAVERGQKVGEGVDLLMTQNGKLALFTHTTMSYGEGPVKNDLWSIDKETGVARKIYQDVMYAPISPKGNMIAVSTQDARVHLIDENGNLLNKVGVYSTSAVFSPDGEKIVYRKLPDNPPESFTLGDLVTHAQGLAVYDINTGKETLVTHGVDDAWPVGFAHDGKNLYFVKDCCSLWSADLKNGGEPVSMLDPKTPVYVNDYDAIWSSDGRSVISKTDGEVSLLHISPSQQSASVTMLGKGGSPRWKVQDKLIEFKGEDGTWKTVDVSQLVSK